MAEITLYPNANAVDGEVSITDQDTTWATIHDTATGNRVNVAPGGDPYPCARIHCSATTNQWQHMFRSAFQFDVSSLEGATINSAIFSVYAKVIVDEISGSQSITLVNTAPASATTLVVADYTDGVEMGTTIYSAARALSSMSINQYEAWTLNATAITALQSAVDAAGIFKTGLRHEADRANSAPTWGNSLNSGLTIYFSGYTGTDYDPKLVIDYTPATTTDYSRGDENVLPAADDDLENLFTAQEYLDVATDDATRVSQTATDENAIFLFKDQNDNNTDQIDVSWNGQSDLAPSQSPVYLQVYNRTTTSWETVDTDDASNADTDFDLTATISIGLNNYYDVSNWVSYRIYQEAI